MTGLRASATWSAWRARWGGIAPLLLAEFVVWVGFGALLPVISLYFADQGVDFATLGLIIAAWPAARLVGEPIFGWLADRTPRVPLMVIGLVVAGLFTIAPLAVTGPLAFFILRAIVGLATAIYDPAARGYLTDATPPERRGEAFGLYGAAQMAGLLIGPAIGAVGAERLGGIAFTFVFAGVSAVIAAVPIARLGREAGPRSHPAPALDATEFPAEAPSVLRRAAEDIAGQPRSVASRPPPSRLLNRGLIAALVVNFGGNYAAGTYDVIWSLFLRGLGAGLDLIGLTFASFGLPILLLSPLAGRLIDRRGAFGFVVIGSLLPAVSGILYTRLVDPVLSVPLILLESTGYAMLTPALYAIVAANAPPGRSSTAQGVFGTAGTAGFIVASLLAGALADRDILYPFYVFVAVMLAALGVGLAIGWSAFRSAIVPSPERGSAAAADG